MIAIYFRITRGWNNPPTRTYYGVPWICTNAVREIWCIFTSFPLLKRGSFYWYFKYTDVCAAFFSNLLICLVFHFKYDVIGTYFILQFDNASGRAKQLSRMVIITYCYYWYVKYTDVCAAYFQIYWFACIPYEIWCDRYLLYLTVW